MSLEIETMKPLANNDNLRNPPASAKLERARRLLADLDGSHDLTLEPQKRKPQPATFPRGWVHEAWAHIPADITPAMAFLLKAVQHNHDPIVWITLQHLSCENGLPYGPGLKAAGIDPARLILVRCRNTREAQWALEESLTINALAAVVGEVNQMDLTASRRLTLVAREHQSLCLLLMRAEHPSSNAAYSRWRLTSHTSNKDLFGLGAPTESRLQATLVKHRGGKPTTTQTLEWPHAPDNCAVPSPMADRETPPHLHTARQRAAG